MNALARLLADMIGHEGPIGLDRYMSLALLHPTLGYYATREPFGTAGDFTTAPEISQIFGELIGLWGAAVWEAIGRPAPVRLIELGPGRGTLAADLFRAAGVRPAFRAALDIHLVEASARLREIQTATLAGIGATATHHRTIDDLPGGPALIAANEFFDALPVRHYVRAAAGWHERQVGLGPDGALVLALAPHQDPALRVVAPLGATLEVGIAARQIMDALARRIAAEGGALLAIDYGYARPTGGETLQALRGGAPADPLDAPGEADLTAHVDFSALAQTARAAGAAAHGPVPQGTFLRRLGIDARANALRTAAPHRATTVDAAMARLTDMSASTAMGALFKVLAITPPGAPMPPGFDPREDPT